ncbi:hypothetical protein AQ490_17195 [Wenjunlia vitaminophila]|uniref:Integral membrane protein n=1 Tax=Wenjunlia vitaminophila TaxID=76728 RepID=A0A0T6LVI4_WENVI|nr:hypothetical protein [Wenjunlia vitaminophila]KRV50142.1 hypothetical protein AQ490_17195 [Wenjunlia vitaminophila]
METTTGLSLGLRTLRAALFTALCLTLSTTSFVLLSDTPLPLATLAVAGLGVFAVALALAGRERRLWQIAAVIVPLELVVDHVFTRAQDTCYGASGGPVVGSWRSVTGTLLCGDGSSFGPTTVELPGHLVPAWWLLLAHLLAALVAAWWLRQGEAAAFRLLRAVAVLAAAPLRLLLGVCPAVAPLPSPARRRREDGPSPTETAVRSYVGRRGPPCPVTAR